MMTKHRPNLPSAETYFSYFFNGAELYGHCHPSAFRGKNHL